MWPSLENNDALDQLNIHGKLTELAKPIHTRPSGNRLGLATNCSLILKASSIIGCAPRVSSLLSRVCLNIGQQFVFLALLVSLAKQIISNWAFS